MTETPSAMQYWQSELANKEEGIKQRYHQYFNEFLTFVDKTPDELIVQRQQDLLNPDRKIQRRIESLLLAFLAKKKAEGSPLQPDKSILHQYDHFLKYTISH